MRVEMPPLGVVTGKGGSPWWVWLARGRGDSASRFAGSNWWLVNDSFINHCAQAACQEVPYDPVLSKLMCSLSHSPESHSQVPIAR